MQTLLYKKFAIYDSVINQGYVAPISVYNPKIFCQGKFKYYISTFNSIKGGCNDHQTNRFFPESWFNSLSEESYVLKIQVLCPQIGGGGGVTVLEACLRNT